MRYISGYLAGMLSESPGYLERGEHQTSRRVKDYVDRHIAIRQANSTQDLFGIVNVDVADNRKPQETHGLLAMDHRDHARVPLSFKARESAAARGFQHVLLYNGLQRGHHEKKPE